MPKISLQPGCENRAPAGTLIGVATLLLCCSTLAIRAQGSGQDSVQKVGQSPGQRLEQKPEPGAEQGAGPNRDLCAAITSMADFKVCYAEEFRKEDMNLNHIYRQGLVVLEHELDDALKRSANDEAGSVNDAIEELKSAQAAWVKYRDLQCRAAGQQYQGGTIQPLVVNQCLILVTMHRIEEIQQAYEIGGRKLE
jgi:uncharacterized protein YecT (DUF1311 family)